VIVASHMKAGGVTDHKLFSFNDLGYSFLHLNALWCDRVTNGF